MALTLRRRSRELTASAPVPVAPPPIGIASPWANADALTVATWAGLLDVAATDLPVTRQQAIQLPAIQRGRDLIATSVARFPLWAMTAAGRTDQQPRIIVQPEVGRSRYVTMLWTVDTLLFYGFAVWQVTSRYAEDARPRTARWVPPGRIDTDPDSGDVTAVFGRPIGDPRDVIRFDGPHEGILTRGAESIRATRLLFRDYAKAVAMPNPDVELHQTAGEPMTPAEINELRTIWAEARAGAYGRVAFTNQSVEAKVHGQQPENLLVAARNAANLDMARLMNLPAWAVDGEVGGSSLTYSNVPSRSRELIDYTLAGYMEAITSRLSLDDVLAAGTWSAFSTDVMTDGDFGDRMTAYKAATEAKVYTSDELRQREAGIPVEGQVRP